MSFYPRDHHPVFFLQKALTALGIRAEYNERDKRTEGCWGLIIEGKPFVWLIDNRWIHEREHEDPAAARLLERGALVCCAQRPDAERIGAKWLPLAVSPGYRPPDNPHPKLYDVGFVGYIHDESRLMLLKELSRHFTVCHANGVFGDDAVKVYWDSKVAVNIPTRYGDPLAYDVPMRVPEILATGTPLITNWLPELEEMSIQQLINCLTYVTPNELMVQIQCLLDDPKWANEIGSKGAVLASEQFTYTQRAQTILEWLECR